MAGYSIGRDQRCRGTHSNSGSPPLEDLGGSRSWPHAAATAWCIRRVPAASARTADEPWTDCVCRKNPRAQRGDGIVRVRREVKGRRGKTVTTLSGIPLPEEELRALAGELKRRCGTGGSAKNGVIEIQGDHRDDPGGITAGEGLLRQARWRLTRGPRCRASASPDGREQRNCRDPSPCAQPTRSKHAWRRREAYRPGIRRQSGRARDHWSEPVAIPRGIREVRGGNRLSTSDPLPASRAMKYPGPVIGAIVWKLNP